MTLVTFEVVPETEEKKKSRLIAMRADIIALTTAQKKDKKINDIDIN